MDEILACLRNQLMAKQKRFKSEELVSEFQMLRFRIVCIHEDVLKTVFFYTRTILKAINRLECCVLRYNEYLVYEGTRIIRAFTAFLLEL